MGKRNAIFIVHLHLRYLLTYQPHRHGRRRSPSFFRQQQKPDDVRHLVPDFAKREQKNIVSELKARQAVDGQTSSFPFISFAWLRGFLFWLAS